MRSRALSELSQAVMSAVRIESLENRRLLSAALSTTARPLSTDTAATTTAPAENTTPDQIITIDPVTAPTPTGDVPPPAVDHLGGIAKPVFVVFTPASPATTTLVDQAAAGITTATTLLPITAIVAPTSLDSTDGPLNNLRFMAVDVSVQDQVQTLTLKVSEPEATPPTVSTVAANEAGDLMDYLDRAAVASNTVPTNPTPAESKVDKVEHEKPATQPAKKQPAPPASTTPKAPVTLNRAVAPAKDLSAPVFASLPIAPATVVAKVVDTKPGNQRTKRSAEFGAAVLLIAVPKHRSGKKRTRKVSGDQRV